jgi:hypothetical protein
MATTLEVTKTISPSSSLGSEASKAAYKSSCGGCSIFVLIGINCMDGNLKIINPGHA